MELELLIVAMNQHDLSLCDDMNVKTNCIIASQCHEYKYISDKDKKAILICSDDIGVGKNRNKALYFSSKDILLFGDEDLVYIDDLENKVLEAYKALPNADAIIFQIESPGKDITAKIKEIRRVRWFNYAKYGAARLSIKKSSIQKYNIKFNELFGGGCKYGSGEDNIFIHDLLKKGAKIYTYPLLIAYEKENKSSWFKGYDEKYFYDNGALMASLYNKRKYIMSIIFLIKRNHSKNLSFFRKLFLYFNGAKNYDELLDYNEWKNKGKGI